MKIFYLTVWFALFLLLAIGCSKKETTASGPVPASVPVAELSNADVTWSGTYAGVDCVLSEKARLELKKISNETGSSRDNARAHLIRMLDKSDQFVVAHVMLTMLSREKFGISATEWNHLQVELARDGSAKISPDQQVGVRNLWAGK